MPATSSPLLDQRRPTGRSSPAGSASGSTPHSRSMSRTCRSGVGPLAPQRQEPLPHHRDRVDGERERHQGVQGPPRPGDGGVEQHQPADRLGTAAGLQDRDHPAHRVADQDGGLADDLAQEPVEHRDVVLHRRAAVAGLAAAEARQVERQHAGVRRGAAARRGPSSGASRRGRAPGRPSEPPSRPAEVDVVHRTAQVDRPALPVRCSLCCAHPCDPPSAVVRGARTVTRAVIRRSPGRHADRHIPAERERLI